MKKIISFFAIYVAFFPTLAVGQNNCLKFKLESHRAYQFTDSYPWARKWLRLQRDKACKRVEDSTWNRKKASEVINAFVLRYGCCRESYINPSFGNWLEEKKTPIPVVKVYQKFCFDTFDSRQKRRAVGYNKLVERVHWLRVELFCQWTRSIAEPEGGMKAFAPDLPSIMRLREQAHSLCEKLRDGQIRHDEAWYRFNQELLWTKQHVGPEMSRYIAEAMSGAVKSLIEILK